MVEAQLSLLLNVGLLTRHSASHERYLFAMPNAGPLVRSIAAGRKVTLLPSVGGSYDAKQVTGVRRPFEGLTQHTFSQVPLQTEFSCGATKVLIFPRRRVVFMLCSCLGRAEATDDVHVSSRILTTVSPSPKLRYCDHTWAGR